MYLYLEFTDEKSAKFWEAHAIEETLTTRWGKIGTDGQEKADDDHDDYAAAAASALKQAEAKHKKGYAYRDPAWYAEMKADEDLWRELRDDVRTRVLMGDSTYFEDTLLGAREALEDAELDGAAAEFYEADEERCAHALASLLWQEAYELSQAYADKPSDSEALLLAMQDLEPDGVEFGLFTDWPSVEADQGVLIGYDEWDRLEPDEESVAAVGVMRVDDKPVAELGERVRAAMQARGLKPREFVRDEGDIESGVIEVPVHWRWRVVPLQDVED